MTLPLPLPDSAITPLLNTVHHADCFDLMARLPDKSVDLFLSDLPYGVHEAAWDKPPDLPRLWTEIERVLVPTGAAVFTAVMAFAVELINSNPIWFKYDLVWVKNKATDFLNAKNKPMRAHEQMLVFAPGTTANGSGRRMYYEPQKINVGRSWRKKDYAKTRDKSTFGTKGRKVFAVDKTREGTNERYPDTVLIFDSVTYPVHPNEKPVDLFQWLIASYSPPNAVILDPFAGSGTTAIAARNTSRHFIIGDSSPEYVAIAEKRLALPYTLPMMLEG